jgi:membrane protein implicated in regulation of membrane protease activity
MKGFVWNRRIAILASLGSIALVWALFFMPNELPWTGLVWLPVFGALVWTLARGVRGVSTRSAGQVIADIEGERMVHVVATPERVAASRRRRRPGSSTMARRAPST